MKDLAQILGVSIPTVSRALKNSPEISRELCIKAQKLAKEMNYHPNPFAMSLRKNTPRTIGVIVPDIVTHFFASILSGIEDTAIANGYFVIITTSHESYDHEKRNIENLVNMHVEGIIGCLSQETTDYAHWLSLDDMNMPLVLFDRVCMPDRFSTVVADGVYSAQMATQHLLDHGSKRIAFIGGANHLDIVRKRKHGYLEALRENKIPIEKVIRNHNLRIPQDIALIGYTDEQHANYVVPRLSAVSHQTYKMGEAACQMLIDKIKGDKKIRQIIIPTCLQVRESSIKRKD